jgi:hypothetical protein
VESVETRIYNGDMAVVNVVLIGDDGARTHVTQVWTLTDDQPLYVRAKGRGAIRLAVNTRLAACCAAARWEMTTSHASAAAAATDPDATSAPMNSQPTDPDRSSMNAPAASSSAPGLIWP